MFASPPGPSRDPLGARLAIATLALVLAGASVAALGADPGRDVAATCASCHGTGGISAGGIASLAGRPKEDLLARMRDFKSGTRGGTVMPQLAKGYTDDQIDVICVWFASQRPAP